MFAMRESRDVLLCYLHAYIYFRWVVGALDSAWAAVCKYLGMNHPEKLKDFYSRWGTNDEWRVTLRAKGGMCAGHTLRE